MKGCEHNAFRSISYDRMEKKGFRGMQHGDMLTLICPHGCPEIFVNLKSTDLHNLKTKKERKSNGK